MRERRTGKKEDGERRKLNPLRIEVSSFALPHIKAEAEDTGKYATAISSEEFRSGFVHCTSMIEDGIAAEGISLVLSRIEKALSAGEDFRFIPQQIPGNNPLNERLFTRIVEGVFDTIIPCNTTDLKQIGKMGKVIKAAQEGRDIVLVSPNSKQAVR